MDKLLKDQFGFLQIEIKKLNGYENLNYLVKTEQGKFTFKTYLEEGDLSALIEAENELLLFLQQPKDPRFPTPIPFKDGALLKSLIIDGEKRLCRMLLFLEGTSMADTRHTKDLFKSFGTFLGQMDKKLLAFNNAVFSAREWEWDIKHLALNKKYISDIEQPRDQNLVRYFLQQYEEHVAPVFYSLRKSIIHNDANEWNVLAQGNQISGIFDFGDVAYTPLINELAVAIAYGCFDKDQPLDFAFPLIEAYHKVLPLQDKEVAILYYLVAARLCISLCNSAHSKKQYPENEYALASAKQAWALLYKWLKINPLEAKNCFRKAIGLKPEKSTPTEQILRKRTQSTPKSLSLSYKHPIYMTRAAFQYMFDGYGNSYLDAYNNIPHVGHCHPVVIEAGQRQMARLNTNTRYLYDLLPEYSEELLSKFPDSLNKVFFVNSGSAASDLAIRLAKAHTGQSAIMVMEGGYHGNTQVGIDISGYKFDHKAGQGQKEHIIKAAIPDTYRGQFRQDDETAGKQYAQEAINQIKNVEKSIAAFICEPIVGCAGQVPLAKGYLKEIYPEIRKQGGVCISDEVQTGFGRVGDYFWGYEQQGVVPDIVILGKPMGNGHPMGAVICTSEIAESFSQGVEFFSSFGGNPVSCAIGLSVLKVIKEEALQENALQVGNFYKSLLLNLHAEFECIGDVRGSGLFLGIELVKDRNSLIPDTELAQFVKNELRNQHILISTDGPYNSVLKTKPPLCFTKENAEHVVEQLRSILKQ